MTKYGVGRSAAVQTRRSGGKAHRTAAILLASAALFLGGCQGNGIAKQLRSAGVGGSPDEFMVLPTRPLEMPTDLADLPVPAPGAGNRVDYDPRAEAVASLSGRQQLATASGAGLVAQTGAGAPGIRSETAQEDADYRASHRGLLLERVIIRDETAVTYRDMVLPAPATYESLRAAGVGVPAAPPILLDDAE